VVATPDVVKHMRQQASPEFVGNFWSVYFPGQISDRIVIGEELKRNVIDLEGHDLVVAEVGHTDTDYTTCLHVPSVGLMVAGDAAYNDVHLYLAESNGEIPIFFGIALYEVLDQHRNVFFPFPERRRVVWENV
jgi:hypothetical protein